MTMENMTKAAPSRETFSYDGKVSHLVGDLITALGEDPLRAGLERTPERVSRMYDELLSGYRTDMNALVNGALFESEYDDIVVVNNIEFTSLCEHHLLPFYGTAHVAYLPNGKIIGLSKIPRIVDMFARRLQVQERMTVEIARAIDEILAPRGVAVLVEGEHMCARIRGVKKAELRMTTRKYLGAFTTDAHAAHDFLRMARRRA
jgi:GTP cyclohydrolase IA